ncbi:DUF167 family protein [Oricola thermophila]|uniref:UPF0235 protein HTY61_16275 n=1 Tax=Oricola thermophila TaxID=2742145 RepID=A0A6N1VJH5_9HYPH|nr:DUF167 family protein [Oricola thermophila]QKV19895.1 DUF167 domain-containing protein [Oricola thermophila]
MGRPAFFRAGDGHADLFLRVTPNASRNAIEGVEIRDDGQARLRVRVTAQPEKGKANKAVVAILSKALHLPKSAFAVVAGDTARDKTVRVEASEAEAALAGLAKDLAD